MIFLQKKIEKKHPHTRKPEILGSMFAEVITLKIKAMDEIIFYIIEGAAICGLFLLAVKFFEPINRLVKRLTGIDMEME